MHPAYSVIWFTTLSGAGYGLAACLGLGLVAMNSATAITAYGAAFAMISIGLISSTLHLGHPERAWRAFSQWRSSWLSREGVLAILTFGPLILCAIPAIFTGAHLTWFGLALTILALATVYTTSMIYASLKTIHQWNTGLTSACYLGFALSSGFLAYTAITAAHEGRAEFIWLAAVLVIASWVLKSMWWNRADTTQSQSTPASALGLPEDANPRRLEVPHTGSNYLQKEMGYVVARKHGAKLRTIALGLGAVVPLMCLVLAMLSGGTIAHVFVAVAAVTHFAGIFIERWLFFAQSQHTVMLYYGAQSA